jgi:iron(III) transport system ATP-binding protein
MTALALTRISHAFGGTQVLHDVTLELSGGEVVCLLGPSGCGKTTTLRIAAGLEPVQTGTVSIDDQQVAGGGMAERAPEERRVGLVFQDYALFPHLTVLGNVAFGLRRLPLAERHRRARAALEQVGMSHTAESYPHTLSGGEQQRVSLARALAPEPAVMLLDEPFSNLDVALRAEIRDETLRLLKATGTATLLVTHDAEEAMFMADRIALMRSGRIVQEGPPAELYAHPKDAFIARLFGELNRITGVVHEGAVTTPLGPFPAGALSEGEPAEVLLRHEVIQLADGPDGISGRSVHASVIGVHLLGPSSLVDLRLESSNQVLRARIPRRAAPPVGARVRVGVDPVDSLIFPAAGEN